MKEIGQKVSVTNRDQIPYIYDKHLTLYAVLYWHEKPGKYKKYGNDPIGYWVNIGLFYNPDVALEWQQRNEYLDGVVTKIVEM